MALLRLTDTSIENLIRHFESEDRPVIIGFFGDHQPRLEQTFYEYLHGGPFQSLDERILQYMVPFFVWANYDIDSHEINCTSLNYLSNYIFEISDIPAPRYTRYLTDLEAHVPAINALGYYSASADHFI